MLVLQGRLALGMVALADVEHPGAWQSPLPGYVFVRPALIAQFDHLHAPLLPRRRTELSHVGQFHQEKIRAIKNVSSCFFELICNQFDYVNCLAMRSKTNNFGLTVVFRG